MLKLNGVLNVQRCKNKNDGKVINELLDECCNSIPLNNAKKHLIIGLSYKICIIKHNYYTICKGPALYHCIGKFTLYNLSFILDRLASTCL